MQLITKVGLRLLVHINASDYLPTTQAAVNWLILKLIGTQK